MSHATRAVIPPSFTLNSLALTLIAAAVTLASSPAHADPTDLGLFQPGVSWKFQRVNGTGSFQVESQDGQRIGVLSYDFSGAAEGGGGRYVLATTDVTIPQGASRLLLKARSAAENRPVTIRLLDSTGQTLQFKRRLKQANTWQALTIDLARKTEHWGGANDGQVHFPIQKLTLIAPFSSPNQPGRVHFAGIAAEGGATQPTPVQTGVNPGPAPRSELFGSGKPWVFQPVNGRGSFKLQEEDGRRVGVLAYDFTGASQGGGGRYVLALTDVEIPAGIERLTLQARSQAEGRPVTIRLVDNSGQTFQRKTRLTAVGQWQDIVVDLSRQMESWGGADDGRINFPIRKIALIAPRSKASPSGEVTFASFATQGTPVASTGQETTVKTDAQIEYNEFNYGQSTGGSEWVQAIRVLSPELRSTVSERVEVEFLATDMDSAKAMLWRQPTDDQPSHWGHDVNLTPDGIELDADHRGRFSFDPAEFPHGPMNVRIMASNAAGKKDVFELQLYNAVGVKWNAGMPDTTPPGAEGWTLVWYDDFDGPLSIANDGRGARYNAHKPRFGDFSGWPFRDHDWSPAPPFEQRDTYLRIKARKPEGTKGGTGLLATVDMDGNGFWAKPPAYLEIRMKAQSAPGSWPAFWTITELDRGEPTDELDIAELYGGVGEGNPNHPGYSIVSHFWRQVNPRGERIRGVSAKPRILELGGRSWWSTTFHTYAVRIDPEFTTYYFDDIEVLKHPTNLRSMDPHCILFNYAIGGISRWPIDLERYGNGSDMWVDYVRVYQKDPTVITAEIPDP